jgi:hypothetical protein
VNGIAASILNSNALHVLARRAVHAHSSMPPDERGAMAAELRTLFSTAGIAFMEAPFHCAYGRTSFRSNKHFSHSQSLAKTA